MRQATSAAQRLKFLASNSKTKLCRSPRWLSRSSRDTHLATRYCSLPPPRMYTSTKPRSDTKSITTSAGASLNNGVTHHAAIALGSNMGDKVGYIEGALTLMAEKGIRVLDVSPLYETKAMYYEQQDTFVNGACRVETSLEPLRLLDELQDIENRLGRVRNIDKGPRTLDLDIILYDDQHIINDRLQVPHKLLLEREFVLKPLNDILPHYVFPSTSSQNGATPQSVASALHKIENPDAAMHRITVLSPNLPAIVSADPYRRTRVMSILNITPDSFSDGGNYSEQNLECVRADVRKQIAAGATIFDIGGQSTRPKADLLTAQEELVRVLPVVEAIRSMPEAAQIAISIDTFYSEVARETVRYGADIINDVSGGLLDSKMLSTVADLGKTIVLMHMRGNPQTMNQLTDYPGGVIEGVAQELSDRIVAARRAGIHPWRIILDPGIGFAKNQHQNCELLKRLGSLRARSEFAGLPWLLGVSRKGFIGKITDVPKASERTMGTAAAVTASIAGGADVVRVHDVAEMTAVSKMADAIYRTG